jgi:hypothetical protein
MKKLTKIYSIYIICLLFVFILFFIPQNFYFSLAERHFSASKLGASLLLLTVAGFVMGFLSASGLLRVPKILGYILMTVAAAVLAKVLLGYSSY